MVIEIREGANRTLYFETSALNSLLVDPDRDETVGRLTGSGNLVLLSDLCVTEMVATKNPVHRRERLELGGLVAQDRRPLADPRDLLRRSIDAFATRSPQMVATTDDARNDSYVALNYPTRIDEGARQRAYELNQKDEKWYRDMHDAARDSMQSEVAQLGSARPRTSAQLLQLYFRRPDFLGGLLKPFLEEYGHPEFVGREQEILIRMEPWKFFFAALSAGVFHRAVKPDGYGWRNNPGAVDTQQAIYLAFADIFITDDLPLRRVMKPIARLANKPRRVMSFRELKGVLFAEPFSGGSLRS